MSCPISDETSLKLADMKFVFDDGHEILAHMYVIKTIKYFERWFLSKGYEIQHIPENHKYYYIFRVKNGVSYESMMFLLKQIYNNTGKIKWSVYLNEIDNSINNFAPTLRFANNIGIKFSSELTWTHWSMLGNL